MSRYLEPIRGRIIVKRIKRNVSPGGLTLPESREQPTVEGEVIAVGPGLMALMNNDPGLIAFDFEGEKYDAITDEQSIITKIKETKDE